MNRDKTHRLTVLYKVLGGHTHIRVFTGRIDGQRGKAGDLVMTNAEFEAWMSNRILIEFKEEETRNEES